jgi:uncharacterized protein YydD (DUF2326 family)
MLLEVRSKAFRTTVITFRPGLNVVLGDENATNSIGKSTLLMVVDFAFGGNTLLEHNSDLVTELGHHDYHFLFQFDGEMYRYSRGTSEPGVVYHCDDLLQPQRVVSIEEYTAFLKQAYHIDLPDISFRALVGLYARVWGKDNLSVERPLHVVQTQSPKDCVSNLIKTFGSFGSIRSLAGRLTSAESEGKALDEAIRHHIVPSLAPREYATNKQEIEALEAELNDIKANLARYATNLSAVVNKEVLALKVEKDDLLALRLKLESRLTRTRRNIAENRHIKSKHFADLLTLFPDINESRLAKIEEFHNVVAKLLRVELSDAERAIQEQLSEVDLSISDIDERMAATLGSVKEPTVLVDRVYDVAVNLQTALEKNDRFEQQRDIRSTVKALKSELADEKLKVLRSIEDIINDGLRRIVTSVFGEGRKSPHLTLKENNYSYDVFEDTGTGTAYASLLMLDLTIFAATQLPVVVHDSLLFKNIENDSVARLVQVYMQSGKQCFIAIDEIEKYGTNTSALLRDRSAIQLDNDHVLYVKDWRT